MDEPVWLLVELLLDDPLELEPEELLEFDELDELDDELDELELLLDFFLVLVELLVVLVELLDEEAFLVEVGEGVALGVAEAEGVELLAPLLLELLLLLESVVVVFVNDAAG